jgi:hypothetical protein
MNRFTLNITAEDLLDLLKKQRSRYSGKLEHAVSSSDFAQAKDLINKLEELELVISANPLPGSDAIVSIDMELSQAPSPSLPRGML